MSDEITSENESSYVESLRLITYTKAAEMIGVSHTVVSELVQQGHLTPRYLPGRSRPKLRFGDVVAMLQGLQSAPSIKRRCCNASRSFGRNP